MGVLLLFVLQVQTLYYSPDHKLVDGGLVIEGHSEVFGGEDDHLQFVQVFQLLGPGFTVIRKPLDAYLGSTERSLTTCVWPCVLKHLDPCLA